MSNIHLDAPQPRTIRRPDAPDDSFARRAILFTGVVLMILVVSVLIWYVAQVFLLVFAGVLLAILLHIPTDWLRDNTPLGPITSLVLVLLAIVAILGTGAWYLAPDFVTQTEQLVEILPVTLQEIRDSLSRYGWARQILEETPSMREMLPSTSNILSRISNIFSGIVGIVTGLLVILFTGLYLAIQPDIYINGVVKLVPRQHQPRTNEVLQNLGHSLRWWLIGRIFSMVVLGIFTGIALWLLNVPFALALGILTGLLSFVPIIGSILAIIPAGLVALSQDPMTLVYVLAVYLAAQTIESYALTPAVQQTAVSLPPVLAFVVQLLLGVLVGALGVALAYPIAIVGMLLVQMLYVEDVLGHAAD